MEKQKQFSQPDVSTSRVDQGSSDGEGRNVPSVSSPRELKVCNLDERTAQQDVTHLFSGMGELEKVELVTSASGGGSPHDKSSIAYVTFKDPNIASQALRSLNGQSYNGKTLMLSWAEKGGMNRRWFRIFVGNISRDVDNDQLRELFEPFGKILRAQVVCEQSSGASRGFGFVTYDTFESAKTAIERMNKAVIGETALETNWAVLRRRDTEDDLRQHPKYYSIFNATFPGNSTIYVGNLPEDVPKDATEKLLQAAFRKYGQIKKVSVSDCVKYAFVVMENKASATCAILGMNGKALCSAGQADAGNLKQVRVNWANNQYVETGNRGRLTRANYAYDSGSAMPLDVEPSYGSQEGFWTPNGRTRSAGFGYRTNQQDMSLFWNAPSVNTGYSYGNANARNQYSSASGVSTFPYGSYYGYNYNYNYRGGGDRTSYYAQGQTAYPATTGGNSASPVSSSQSGRAGTSGYTNRPQQSQRSFM
ncbi:unnamed protein product [Orchesella dallaii]|uniref:RRM domain-containing protein n=1 Tax=Orchesella dallaii TaxID=48710 RepID=A0ABP1RB63_9HEXA